MTTISFRIKEAMSLRNIKQSELVEKTGISKGALSSYISGRYNPKQGNLFLLARALNVSEAWLMGADVPIERPARSSDSVIDSRFLTADQAALLADYDKLNPEGKAEARKQVSNLAKIPDYTEDAGNTASRKLPAS